MAVRQPWGQASLRLDSSAPLCFAPLHSALYWPALARLVQCFIFVVQLQLGKYSLQSLVKRESALCRPEGSWLTRTDVLAPIPDWSPNEDSRSSWLDCSRDAGLIGQNGAARIGWWNRWCCYSCTALIGQEKPQSYWLKYCSRNFFFFKLGLVRTVQASSSWWLAGSLVQVSP